MLDLGARQPSASLDPSAQGLGAGQPSTSSNPSSSGLGARTDNVLPTLGLGVGPPSALSDLEAMEVHEGLVMEINIDPTAEPDPPTDWRTPYLDYLL